MLNNINLGSIRVNFEGENPFSASQSGHVLLLVEQLYNRFSDQVLKISGFNLTIRNACPNFSSFDLIPMSLEPINLKYSDFEELTMCFLYSIYSINLEYDFETSDDESKFIHEKVFSLMDEVKQNQKLVLSSVINDKIVKINISTNREVKLEKVDYVPPKLPLQTREDIINAYKAYKKSVFVGCSLEEFDFSELNLSEANFSSAELSGSNFTSANLTETNFLEADVSNANLLQAILTKSNLVKADFSTSNLTRADLSQANLAEIDMSSANLTEAILTDVIISGADFSSSNLTNTVFSGNIIFNKNTDFSLNANWWDAKIEDEKLVTWLNKYYPRQ